MFVFYSIHYPLAGKEAHGARLMREFDELLRQEPGVLFVSDIFYDQQQNALIGYTFWESREAWSEAWPRLAAMVPRDGWEAGPPVVKMYSSAP